MKVERRSKSLITSKELRDEELKDIASQVAKDVIKLQEEGEEEMELDDIDSFNDDLQNEAKDRSEKNAFILAEALEANNIPYEFKITKDHEHKCFWSKPLNEDILAQEMGGGNYTVALYKTNPKRYVKSTTIRIAEPQRKASDKAESKDNTEILLKVIEDRSKAMEQTFRDKEERLERDRERERNEYKAERERERDERRIEEAKRASDERSGKGNMLEMIEIIAKIMPKPEPVKDNSEQFYKLMMEMQKSTTTLMERMNDKNMEMIKELKADTKDMIEKMKPKKEGMSDVEILMKLQETAKESKKEAKEEFMLFQEMVEIKALEKAEILSGQGPKEEKEDSVINNLISSLGPMLVQGVMKSRQQAQIAPPQAPRQVVQAKVAPQNKANPRKAKPLPEQMQKRPVDSTGQNTVSEPKRSEVVEVRPITTFSPMNGGHTINIPANNLEKVETSPIIDREEEQDRVGAVISGVIMEGVQGKKPALEVSNKCYNLLSSANLVTSRVFEYFPKDMLIALRDDYSPETKDEWINEFYDNLQSKFSQHGQYVEPSYGGIN
jgi:hypothetical protein